MSRVEVIADEPMPDVALAIVLRRLADRLDPPRFVQPARRSHPKILGIRWDVSRSGTLLTCSWCDWRSGPHETEELAEPYARTHSNACSLPRAAAARRRA